MEKGAGTGPSRRPMRSSSADALTRTSFSSTWPERIDIFKFAASRPKENVKEERAGGAGERTEGREEEEEELCENG